MSDFLTNLVSRSFDSHPAVRPRPASLYEPLPMSDKMIAGDLFDSANSDQREARDFLLSKSSPLPRQPEPVPHASSVTTAQPSRVAPADQSDEPLETSQDTHRPEDIFFATEPAPDKSRPGEPVADQPRELSANDFSAPQRSRSDRVVQTAIIHSPEKENSPRLDLAQSSSSKSRDDRPEANPEYEIDKDVRLVLESLVDQVIGEAHDSTGTTQPPVTPTQIAALTLSGTEKASRSAPDQVVHLVTNQRIVSAGESPERFIEVEDEPLTDRSVQETASAQEIKPKASSPTVRPVTIERTVLANESTLRFVDTEDVSLPRAPVRQTPSTQETGLPASSPAVHPVTIESIVPIDESTPRFVDTEDVSVTRAPVRQTPSTQETRLHTSRTAVRPVTIESIVPTNEFTPRFVDTEDVSITRAPVGQTPSTQETRLHTSRTAVHPVTIERIVSGGESSQPHFFAKSSPFVHDVSPARTTVPSQPPMIMVHPEISQVRPAAETRVDSPGPEPNVQITIGRIEVRATKAAEVQPKNDRPTQSTLMSLDDYLRQRAQGGKR